MTDVALITAGIVGVSLALGLILGAGAHLGWLLVQLLRARARMRRHPLLIDRIAAPGAHRVGNTALYAARQDTTGR